MPTKVELEATVATLTANLAEANARVERAESGDSQMSAVVGYYILNPEAPDDLWDGTLHPTIAAAEKSLDDPSLREAGPNHGWRIVECRHVGAPDVAFWPRIEKAIFSTTMGRADAQWQWPTCHKAKCQQDHGDIEFVFGHMAKAVAQNVYTELLCRTTSEPDLDDAA